MKKELKYYIAAWVTAVAVFHVIAFVIPKTIIASSTEKFWMIYAMVMIGFIGLAACSVYYASKEKKEERFLAIPVVMIGYIALLMLLLAGVEAIVLRLLPEWLILAIGAAIVAYDALAVIKSAAAAEMVLDAEERTKKTTELFYELTAKAKALEQGADPKLRQSIKKVYEGFRYSDPVSSEATEALDEQIKETYESFAMAVRNQKPEEAGTTADQINRLVKERNEVCRMRK